MAEPHIVRIFIPHSLDMTYAKAMRDSPSLWEFLETQVVSSAIKLKPMRWRNTIETLPTDDPAMICVPSDETCPDEIVERCHELGHLLFQNNDLVRKRGRLSGYTELLQAAETFLDNLEHTQGE